MTKSQKRLNQELSTIDIELYKPILNQAIQNYRLDISYAVKMCQAGKIVLNRKESQAAKRAERKASESQADRANDTIEVALSSTKQS